MLRFHTTWSVLLLTTAAVQLPAAAQEGRFELGFRGLILLGKGTPANDMIGQGLVGRLAFGELWQLGVALDGVQFDYETPNRTLGIAATAVVDGLNEWRRVGVFVERRYESDRRWNWHWLAGVASASLETVDNVAGFTAGGDAFDIATVAADELHVFAGGGLHRTLGTQWVLRAALTFENHGTDYELTDRVSGARGTIGSQSVYGIAVGVSYRF